MLEFFLLETLKTAFLMRHLTLRWTQYGYFVRNYCKICVHFQQKAGEVSLSPPLIAHLTYLPLSEINKKLW